MAWGAAFFLVWPFGEFPLNDDWAYVKNVYYLSETGHLQFSDWPAMTLIVQTLGGAGISRLFGFSFTTLRLSTFLVGWLGMLVAYTLFLRHSQQRILAFFAAILLAFNPLYFSLSYTFMTEVPFLALFLGAAYGYARYLESGRPAWLAGATFLAVAATLIRQTGVLLPLCFGAAAGYFLWKDWKKMGIGLAASFIPLGTLTLYVQWLKNYHGLPASFSTLGDFWSAFSWANLWGRGTIRATILLLQQGIFLLPLLVLIFPGLWRQSAAKQRWVWLLPACLLLYPLWKYRVEIPFGNVFYNLGLGPKTLKDTYWNEHVDPQLTGGWLQLLRCMAVAGALLLVTSLLAASGRVRAAQVRPLPLLTLLVVIGYSVFILPGSFFFDRYMLLLTPFLMLLVLPKAISFQRTSQLAALGLLAFYLFFSVAATHDYLAWNRARWTGLQALMQQGISPKQIDGGFEFNGWYETAPRGPEEKDLKSWWFVADDAYVAAFGDLPCYERWSALPYTRFLNFDQDSVYILKRRSGTQPRIITSDLESVADSSHFRTTDTLVLEGVSNRRAVTAAHSGRYAIALDERHEFAAKVRLPNITPCTRLVLSAWCRHHPESVGFVCSAPGDSDHFYRLRGDLTAEKAGEWQLIRHELVIPADYAWPTLDIYLWNHGKKPVEVDDLKIEIYQ